MRSLAFVLIAAVFLAGCSRGYLVKPAPEKEVLLATSEKPEQWIFENIPDRPISPSQHWSNDNCTVVVGIQDRNGSEWQGYVIRPTPNLDLRPFKGIRVTGELFTEAFSTDINANKIMVLAGVTYGPYGYFHDVNYYDLLSFHASHRSNVVLPFDASIDFTTTPLARYGRLSFHIETSASLDQPDPEHHSSSALVHLKQIRVFGIL